MSLITKLQYILIKKQVKYIEIQLKCQKTYRKMGSKNNQLQKTLNNRIFKSTKRKIVQELGFCQKIHYVIDGATKYGLIRGPKGTIGTRMM